MSDLVNWANTHTHMSIELLVMPHFIVSICCNFMDGVPQGSEQVVNLEWNTVLSDKRRDMHFSSSLLHLLPSPRLSFAFLSLFPSFTASSITLFFHPHSHHHHPWLWSYKIHFWHLRLSVLILPRGDSELRAVTDKFLFCSWCRVKRRDVVPQ